MVVHRGDSGARPSSTASCAASRSSSSVVRAAGARGLGALRHRRRRRRGRASGPGTGVRGEAHHPPALEVASARCAPEPGGQARHARARTSAGRRSRRGGGGRRGRSRSPRPGDARRRSARQSEQRRSSRPWASRSSSEIEVRRLGRLVRRGEQLGHLVHELEEQVRALQQRGALVLVRRVQQGRPRVARAAPEVRGHHVRRHAVRRPPTRPLAEALEVGGGGAAVLGQPAEHQVDVPAHPGPELVARGLEALVLRPGPEAVEHTLGELRPRRSGGRSA